MRTNISNGQFDEERALYNLQKADVVECIFAGPADGESVLKESRDVNLYKCSFFPAVSPVACAWIRDGGFHHG